jgi:predicted Zn-dependent protease
MSLLIYLLLSANQIQASPITTVENQVVRWPVTANSPSVTYYIDSTVDTTLAGWTRSAASTWSGVSTSYLRLVETGSSSVANIIVYADQANTGTQDTMFANVNRDGSTGDIVSCLVHMASNADVNSDQYSGYTQYLKSSIIHELGHCVGLQHSIMSNSIMSYRNGSPLSPGGDDVYAITLLYPADGNQQYPMGCATTQNVDRKSCDACNQGTRAGEYAFLFVLTVFGYFLSRFQAFRKIFILECGVED